MVAKLCFKLIIQSNNTYNIVMKKHLLLLCILLGLVGTRVSAYDFEVDGMYYNIISVADLTCEITSGDKEYSGYIEIPSTVKYGNKILEVIEIGEKTFQRCKDLKSVIIPNSITSIGKEAFEGCSSLNSTNIPNSITSIGEEAFNGCSSLESFNIPSSVTSVGKSAFGGCQFINLVIEDRTTYLELRESILSSANHDDKEATVYIGMELKHNDLSYWYKFEHIILGESIKELEDFALSTENSYVKSITLPNTITSIGESAFAGCSKLESINIPSSVESIGKNAFWECSSLKSINIPSKVQDIYLNTFSGCSSLKTLIIDDRSTTLTEGKNNSYSDKGFTLFESCSSLENLYLGGDFEGLSSNSTIKSITFGKSIKDIKKFPTFSNLSTVNIPDGVESIGGFPESSITSISIPNSVKSIGDAAFKNCKLLTSITIPNSVKSIGSSAFHGCYSLTNITIPNSITSINSYLFYDCNNLESINFEGNIDFIGSYAFAFCKKLTHITLPNSVMNIENNAFTNTGLTLFIIPENVKSIGSKAFSDCSNLNCIVSYPTIPPTLGEGSFTQLQYASNIKVLVPEESLSAYTKADTWINFWNISPISFAFEPEELELFVGDSKNLILTSPELSNSVIWSSSNNEIATIENGIVTGVSEGTVTITAQAGNYTTTCTVTVIPKYIEVTRIMLDRVSATLEEGENIVLTATLTPNDATNKDVSWSSSNTNVATVINGVVKAISAGTTTITAKAGKCTATCVITVTSKYVAVTGIKLNKESAELHEGGTIILIATVTPDNATDKTIIWTSSNTSVAIVNDGIVTAVSPGTATITAKVGNYTAKCIVNVVKSFVLGDVNGDNLIVVDDVVFTINHILGISSENFVTEAADMTGDGVILVDDVVQIINTVLGVNNVNTFTTRNVIHETWNVSCDANEQGMNNLDITLGHTEEYVAMQFDMTLPTDTHLEDIQLTTDSNHSIAFNNIGDGVIRVLITSLTNDAFTEEDLLSISIYTQEDENIRFSNAYVATTQGKIVHLSETEVNTLHSETTRIQIISKGNTPTDIYDLSGRLVVPKSESLEDLQKGIYLINGKKIIVK